MIFIPPKDSEHCIINFFDTKTGENLGHVEDIEEVNMKKNSKCLATFDIIKFFRFIRGVL